MAQLNPNFEIDFNDINSYEQIQLINDTQLAKENLLMHRAYKEPADDAIIRNQFSSFTFVDFCPKLFTLKQPAPAPSGSASSPAPLSSTIRHYELETFSDLFERINVWLKLNKDWRVVSMETLVFDCTSQFNHHKSSIHANYLPKNTRGLRLFLSPSKSRFSGPQKVGCINVVPRKTSGSHLRQGNDDDAEPVEYETLDQILTRLNELLLTRPIEGRILSVETITLPMVNGYVNTETNYFMDNRLNLLNQRTYSLADVPMPIASRAAGAEPGQTAAAHTLIDILRVYYEFGPMVCGLVNLIDFVPRFYSTVDVAEHHQPHHHHHQAESAPAAAESCGQAEEHAHSTTADQEKFVVGTNPKITATESMTRLIRRSLSWFEAERERVLGQIAPAGEKLVAPSEADSETSKPSGLKTRLNLKLCNLQIHSKIMLKNELIQVKPANALERIQTKRMIHERRRKAAARESPAIVCHLCESPTTSTTDDTDAVQFKVHTNLPTNEWCSHLVDLAEPYELRFVRLAYIVPVNQTKSRVNTHPLALSRPVGAAPARRAGKSSGQQKTSHNNDIDEEEEPEPEQQQAAAPSSTSSATTTSSSSSSGSCSASPETSRSRRESNSKSATESESDEGEEEEGEDEEEDEANHEALEENDEVKFVEKLLAQGDSEEASKQCALESIKTTNRLHGDMELAHQLKSDSASDYDSSPIGQLTYRLFAPCQLVNSSSCFAINPVNSSSPLARRGSVDLNGTGGGSSSSGSASNQQPTVGCLSSENANPTSLLLPQANQPQIVSFGAFFPALTSHDLMISSSSGGGGDSSNKPPAAASNSRFTTNEFESVEAIRRRMEIYVTTNSMKVLAGETLIINLSDQLSCLSTAIEQTVVRASFGQRAASTWVSVYILYAAVEEPAKQLLEHQRRLAKISEEEEAEEAPTSSQTDEQLVPVFEDDFKSIEELKKYQQERQKQAKAAAPSEPDTRQAAEQQLDNSLASIHIEQNPCDSSLTLYNSAYDRTVALPTQPDNHLSHYLEPNEFLGAQDDCIWLDENDLIEAQYQTDQQQQLEYRFITIDGSTSTLKQTKQQRDSSRQRGKTYRKIGSKSLARRKVGRRKDSQCSIM